MEEERIATIEEKELQRLKERSDMISLLKCFTEWTRLPTKSYDSKVIMEAMDIAKNILALRV